MAVIDRIEAHAEALAANAPDNESLGRLTDDTAQRMREIGVIRMLQPSSHGGAETHPRDFGEAVMALSALDGATGWVAGVVGVHPWEMALADPKVRDEVWGEDPDVWMASPYAPMGIARPVDGGYVFNGHWQFSSGTDHSDWVFLGAFLGDEEGNRVMPPQSMHMILPRSDYEIVEDSWDVAGLRGTGSKDVIVRDAFVPDHRALMASDVTEGVLARKHGLENPLYHVPFWVMFPLGLTAAVIGMAEGALAHHLAYQRNRTAITGTKIKDDPYVLSVIGEQSANIDAARTIVLDSVSRVYDTVAAGGEIDFAGRVHHRKLQVHAAWMAARAVFEIMARSGGNAMRSDNPIQRFWRDSTIGLNHAIHVPGTVNHVAGLSQLGLEPPPGPMRATF